eukprot:CAMPEP_0171304950 /NCGR_PEP_ID=MMETSP0816-20121228/14719_1 /TAXON_ID=420281 /ORGANISM="Proboscia inermis, Strain CCAP1064/1" /LENGTH=191 /DNA_ID=CAMNT_0011785391 /DNA_START=26 /DNA_END=601 /DNA_ORIENTATION=-
MSSSTSKQILGQFITSLSTKQPTPGGGAAAAIGGAIGGAAAQMAAAYTQRKKDKESGAAAKADQLIASINLEKYLQGADDDAVAYMDLQRTWKDSSMSPEEKKDIEMRALAVPTNLLEMCHEDVMNISNFLPHCNPNITSDAKVGIHQLAGAARAAFQTVMVNSPPDDERIRLKGLLKEINKVEDEILDLE